MSRVQIAAQGWGVLQDHGGIGQANVTVTITTAAGAATVYAAATGTTTTATLTDSDGRIPGWLDEGTYTVAYPTGSSYTVEAVSGRSGAIRLTASGDATGALDTANLAAAATVGGTIEFGVGTFYLTAFPSFYGTTSVTLAGQGGRSAGSAPATRLVYSGTASINVHSALGFRVRDLALTYTSGSLAGKVFDLAHGSGVAPETTTTDAAFCSFERCTITGTVTTAVGATSLISLENAHDVQIRDCLFNYAVCAIRGKTISGDYSNRILIEGCEFGQTSQAPIQNAGQAWTVKSCTFEGLSNGNAGAFSQPTGASVALTLEGCWMGDVNTSGTWVSGASGSSSLSVRGCYLTGGATAISVGSSTFGVVVMGNHFEGTGGAALAKGVDVAVSCTNLVVHGNQFKNSGATIVTTPITLADNPAPAILQNTSGAELRAAQGSVSSATTITLTGGASVYSITGTTNITSVTASWPGRIVTLAFAGILTFTDGSNLKLAGDFVTTADDTITLFSDGVNWLEMARSVN